MHFKSTVILLIISCLLACQSNKSEVSSKSSPYEDLLIFPDANDKSALQDIPVMEFETTEYDFDRVLEKEKVEHTYYFKNTGKMDLVILDTESSCGCTVPEYSKEPVRPGEKGEIKIVFDTTGKSGFQDKKVTIFTNTNPNKYFLTIKGLVISNE